MPSKWIAPLLKLQLRSGLQQYIKYIRDWRSYARHPHAEPLALSDAKPMLFDSTRTTSFDAHYLYQGVWLFDHVQKQQPTYHVDVASLVQYGAFLSQITKVYFLDIRPAQVQVDQHTAVDASILDLPFATDSIESLSCLHVAEHIGLGRYGDPIDPQGTAKAIAELIRVLAPGGYLYFSLPIGRDRVQFNAHRIQSPHRIMQMFENLELQQFAVVDDNRMYRVDVDPTPYNQATYACGMFCYQKPDVN